jgi:hypothetical protein
VAGVRAGYQRGMQKRERVPDNAPGVEIPDDNEGDARDDDALEKLGETLTPEPDDERG